jgi:hypothetical protein
LSESILVSIKHAVGIPDDYDVFDPDVIMHINTAFATLNQLGIGPAQGFRIEDESATWDSVLNGDDRFNDAKSYVFLRVRMLFDPPSTSFLLEAMKEQIKEFEWRLNVKREEEEWTPPTSKSTRSWPTSA